MFHAFIMRAVLISVEKYIYELISLDLAVDLCVAERCLQC